MTRSWEEWQAVFYQRVCADNRVGPTHISLYFALLHEAGHTIAIPFYLRRAIVAKTSKIYSPVTLNRCLKELHAYGYIDYRPSFTPRQTMVEIVMIEHERNAQLPGKSIAP